MRQLGMVPDQASAQRFADYLLTKQIPVSVDPAPGGWAIWVRNEDHLEEARRQFVEFSAAPNAPIYREAARPAEQLRADEQRRSAEARRNFVNVGGRWRRGGASRAPVTYTLLAVSIVFALLSGLGQNRSFLMHFFFDVEWDTPEGPVIAHVWKEEPWRLITPIFLHFSIWHILFNMMWLVQLGQIIETLRGSLRFALMVLVIALTSNIGQFLWTGSPYFGGMSGVVYGLFGYVWMKSWYERGSGFFVTTNMVFWMIGWYVLCLTGVVGPVANAAHGFGLLTGVVLGRWRSALGMTR
ncbi:MAG TPA: rhomboid family intramembrane serine protease [Planctomycetaceae bacterium]|nr:rhomboid family intramembrane serine protease [Planctomycetaceae bacterium]